MNNDQIQEQTGSSLAEQQISSGEGGLAYMQ